jgi:hypothetical protein
MAHRRRRHRRARENPLSDTTKIAIAVGVTAAVVGVGYFLYRRQQAGPTAGAQQFQPPQQMLQSTRDTEATPSKPQGSSTQSGADGSTTSTATLAPRMPPIPPGCIPIATPPYYSCPPQKTLTVQQTMAAASQFYAPPPQGQQMDYEGNY